MKRVYWDSCCFISYLKGDARGEQLKGIVESSEAHELEIVTSVIAIAEVLKISDEGSGDDRKRIVETMTSRPGLTIVELTPHLATEARDIIWRISYEKHQCDAIHLATASWVHKFKPIDELHSFDNDMLKLDGKGYIPIPIIKPTLSMYPCKPERMFEPDGTVRNELMEGAGQ